MPNGPILGLIDGAPVCFDLSTRPAMPRFDVTLPYDVSIAQWGTLRVWDISEADGQRVAVREYPVYLRPAP